MWRSFYRLCLEYRMKYEDPVSDIHIAKLMELGATRELLPDGLVCERIVEAGNYRYRVAKAADGPFRDYMAEVDPDCKWDREQARAKTNINVCRSRPSISRTCVCVFAVSQSARCASRSAAAPTGAARRHQVPRQGVHPAVAGVTKIACLAGFSAKRPRGHWGRWG